MYTRDATLIGQYARSNAENMRRVYAFVIATVQQPLDMVGDILDDIDKEGEASRFLWGWKPQAWRYARDNAQEIYDGAMTLWDFSETDRDAEDLLVGYYAGMPGLGLAKGGFMAQLCFGLSGCLDSHNVALHGLDPRQFAAARFKGAKTKKTRDRIVKTYNTTVDACGGGQVLWDSWCEHVANLPNKFKSADGVSRYHSDVLIAA